MLSGSCIADLVGCLGSTASSRGRDCIPFNYLIVNQMRVKWLVEMLQSGMLRNTPKPKQQTDVYTKYLTLPNNADARVYMVARANISIPRTEPEEVFRAAIQDPSAAASSKNQEIYLCLQPDL